MLTQKDHNPYLNRDKCLILLNRVLKFKKLPILTLLLLIILIKDFVLYRYQLQDIDESGKERSKILIRFIVGEAGNS